MKTCILIMILFVSLSCVKQDDCEAEINNINDYYSIQLAKTSDVNQRALINDMWTRQLALACK